MNLKSNLLDVKLIGNSASLQTVLRAANLVAATDVSVLVLGESGTGKELLAHHLHRNGGRATGPFVTVNCAALPESLAESELFGHRRGAFTGALQDRTGRLQAAEGGTLFLDEVGELPLNLQAKLLRFLESGECQMLGTHTVTRVDARVIAATNRDLYAQVQAGRFREDLYYRLHVVPLELPPLRARGDDVLRLLDWFTSDLARSHGLAAPRYSDSARTVLRTYHWPGNVRELRNFCERMLILCPGCVIGVDNLPREFRCADQERPSAGLALPETGIDLYQFEADMIRQALAKTGGNQSRAARLLGLTRDTFLYRLKKYAIEA
jgi:transcriptional regulator with GAF, ATPase, and Fis domain